MGSGSAIPCHIDGRASIPAEPQRSTGILPVIPFSCSPLSARRAAGRARLLPSLLSCGSQPVMQRNGRLRSILGSTAHYLLPPLIRGGRGGPKAVRESNPMVPRNGLCKETGDGVPWEPQRRSAIRRNNRQSPSHPLFLSSRTHPARASPATRRYDQR
jgi:hypothetical protein